jgi:hypothetical protein
MTYVMIDAAWLNKLRSIATKLYREERLNGDEMRDMGHALTGLASSAIEVPDESVPAECGHPGCGGRITALVCDRCRSY